MARYGAGVPGSGQSPQPPAQDAQTANQAPKQQGAQHPTIPFLIVLVVAEWGLLAVLRYIFRHVHGG